MDSVSYLPGSGSAGCSCSSGCVCQDKKTSAWHPQLLCNFQMPEMAEAAVLPEQSCCDSELQRSRSETENLPPQQTGPGNVLLKPLLLPSGTVLFWATCPRKSSIRQFPSDFSSKHTRFWQLFQALRNPSIEVNFIRSKDPVQKSHTICFLDRERMTRPNSSFQVLFTFITTPSNCSSSSQCEHWFHSGVRIFAFQSCADQNLPKPLFHRRV